jgi:hypothetical protein
MKNRQESAASNADIPNTIIVIIEVAAGSQLEFVSAASGSSQVLFKRSTAFPIKQSVMRVPCTNK